MAKRLNGIVVTSNMVDSALVEITRKVAHPIYKKLLKRSKTFKVDTKEVKVSVGDHVSIVETRPISKDKHFKVEKVISTKGGEK